MSPEDQRFLRILVAREEPYNGGIGKPQNLGAPRGGVSKVCKLSECC